MKSVLKLLALALIFPGFALAQKGEYKSCSPATPPVIDGNVDEWQSEWTLDPKGKFIYSICNDDDNLYIRLKISDDMTQRKIGLFGLTVYLSPKGKKVGKVGLKYPTAKDMTEYKPDQHIGANGRPDLIEMKKDLVRDAEVVELVGLSKENIVSPRLGLTNGIQAMITADQGGTYIYEARIPFKAFHIDKSKVKLLGVDFVTGRLISKPPPGGYNQQQGPGGGVGNIGYSRQYQNSMANQGYYSNLSRSTNYNPFESSTTMLIGVKLQ
jgi:hypothetical protein